VAASAFLGDTGSAEVAMERDAVARPARPRAGLDRDGVVASLAAAAAVLAALLTPAVLARFTVDRGASITRLADTVLPAEGPGARDWTARDCRDDLCGVPIRLRLHGRDYDRGPGGQQPVVRRDVRTRTLTWDLEQVGAPGHSVLVGALRSSSATELQVQLGSQPPFEVPFGRLTLLRVPPGVSSVTVIEGGRPAATEELRVQEYVGR
jgi:hypothetical protein